MFRSKDLKQELPERIETALDVPAIIIVLNSDGVSKIVFPVHQETV